MGRAAPYDQGCGPTLERVGDGGNSNLMANIERVRTGVRVGISAFVLILLVTVVLGMVWTSHHQAPPLRTASHVVLAIAGAAGLFGLAKIWRTDGAPPQAERGRRQHT